MKKFLSLLTVVAILFTVSVMPAFAADYSAVYKVEGDTGAVGDIITVTLTYKGASQVYMLQGFLNFNQSVVAPAQSSGTVITYKADGTATKTNAKKAIVSSLCDATHESGDYEGEKVWGQENITADSNSGKFGIMLCVEGSDSDSTLYDVDSDGFEFYTLRFVRVAEGNADFKLDATLATKMEISNASGDVIKGNVTIDYTAPGGNGGEVGGNDSFDATVEDVGANWDAKFDYKDATGTVQENATYTGKKVVAFGKAATELAAEAYGVQIGNRTYKGLLPVAAGEYFAIIVINTASDAAILNSYKYQVWTGSEDAPEYKTEKLDAYIAQ